MSVPFRGGIVASDGKSTWYYDGEICKELPLPVPTAPAQGTCHSNVNYAEPAYSQEVHAYQSGIPGTRCNCGLKTWLGEPDWLKDAR